jgi:hypothetical protein
MIPNNELPSTQLRASTPLAGPASLGAPAQLQSNTTNINPERTVQGLLPGIMDRNNPLMQMAIRDSNVDAQSRGLLSSSIATENAANSVMRSALPIAQQDAGLYGQAALQDSSYLQQGGLNTQNFQNTGSLNTQQFQNQGALNSQNYSNQGNLQSQQYGINSNLANQQFGYNRNLAADQQGYNRELQSDQFGFNTDLASQQGQINSGLQAEQGLINSNLANQQFGYNTNLATQQGQINSGLQAQQFGQNSALQTEQYGFNRNLASQQTSDQMRINSANTANTIGVNNAINANNINAMVAENAARIANDTTIAQEDRGAAINAMTFASTGEAASNATNEYFANRPDTIAAVETAQTQAAQGVKPAGSGTATMYLSENQYVVMNSHGHRMRFGNEQEANNWLRMNP